MKKKLTAIVLAMLAFSMIAASAASLGGINTSSLGAETDVVAGCDSDGIDVDFTVAYSAADGEYMTSTVDITGIASPGCDGQEISVTLTDTAGTDIGSATHTLLAGQTSWSPAITASAAAVEGIAVVIDG